MLLIPAVDVKGGQAVRLRQGRAEEATVYEADPAAAARRWAAAGARRIHLVDLDGAFAGQPLNAHHLLRLMGEIAGVEWEVGGGLRRMEDLEQYLGAGAARCVLGTQAVENRAFAAEAARRFPGRISLGLDARGGWLATRGWVETTALRATDLLRELAGLPWGEVIYTDIETDGMLRGPNLRELETMLRASPFPLIASGGICAREHLRALRQLGCWGCIVGKALYDGRLSVEEALLEAAGGGGAVPN